MRSIWSLEAPPTPATACFTWFGEYSTTSQPAATASAIAMPGGLGDRDGRAHVHLEEHPLDGDHRGPVLAAAAPGGRAAARPGAAAVGQGRRRCAARRRRTARAPAACCSHEAVAAAGQPGSMPSTNTRSIVPAAPAAGGGSSRRRRDAGRHHVRDHDHERRRADTFAPMPPPPTRDRARGRGEALRRRTAPSTTSRLRVPGGQITVLLGPNGAGKTTAIRMITGAFAPDAGTVRVFGLDPAVDGDDGPRPLRRRVRQAGALRPPVRARQPPRTRPSSTASAAAPPVDARIREAAARFGIEAALDDQVGGYSTGMKTRLALARQRAAPSPSCCSTTSRPPASTPSRRTPCSS